MVNIKILFFFILFIIFSYTSLSANSIIINSKTENIDILKSSYIFLDKDSRENISDIVKQDKEFMPALKNFVNYGYIFKDTVWVKFKIKNNSDKDIVKYLVFDNPNTDIVNLHF